MHRVSRLDEPASERSAQLQRIARAVLCYVELIFFPRQKQLCDCRAASWEDAERRGGHSGLSKRNKKHHHHCGIHLSRRLPLLLGAQLSPSLVCIDSQLLSVFSIGIPEVY